MEDEGCKKFIALYRVAFDGPLKPDESIERVEFVPLKNLLEMIKKSERRFTPTSLQVLDYFGGRTKMTGRI